MEDSTMEMSTLRPKLITKPVQYSKDPWYTMSIDALDISSSGFDPAIWLKYMNSFGIAIQSGDRPSDVIKKLINT